MVLFKRKNKGKNKVDSSKSKVFDKPKLVVGKNIDGQKVEEIIKTTDSMKIVSSSYEIDDSLKTGKFEEVSRAILKSYDLAVRKIASTYTEIIETKKVVSNDFLTVQIMIKDYEANNNISSINKLINVFYEEFENQIANGKTVKLHERLIVEPTDYSNKMIPIAHFVSDGFTNVNIVSWDEIAQSLNEKSLISTSEIETIKILLEAIITNVENGYYVNFGNIVIARIRPDSSDLMILFSSETILRLNQVYSKERLKRRAKEKTKSNYISSFKKSVEKTTGYDEKIINRIQENEKTGKKNLKDNVEKILKKEEFIKEKVDKNILENKKAKKTKKLNKKNSSFDKKPIEERILSKIKDNKKLTSVNKTSSISTKKVNSPKKAASVNKTSSISTKKVNSPKKAASVNKTSSISTKKVNSPKKAASVNKTSSISTKKVNSPKKAASVNKTSSISTKKLTSPKKAASVNKTSSISTKKLTSQKKVTSSKKNSIENIKNSNQKGSSYKKM